MLGLISVSWQGSVFVEVVLWGTTAKIKSLVSRLMHESVFGKFFVQTVRQEADEMLEQDDFSSSFYYSYSCLQYILIILENTTYH